MKKRMYIFNLLMLAALLGFSSAAVFAAGNQNEIMELQKDTTEQKVVTYEVFGMDCPGCQSALEKQVKKIDGVADAKASFKEKQVVIELKPDAKVSDKEIE
nr:heavy-metal-associated domain-containing protein [Sunxiuqinia sp.]